MTNTTNHACAWLHRPVRRPHARLRLLCIPFAGSGPQIFRSWSKLLPDDVEVVALHLPGRGNRVAEPPFAKWPELLESLVPVLLRNLPFPAAFFGHSMGAMLAYELSRCLVDTAGIRPETLFLSACRVPHLAPLEPILHLADEAVFHEGLRCMAGTPPEILSNHVLMALLTPMLRADIALAETWPPKPPVLTDVPIVTFAGLDDRIAPVARMRGWSAYTRGSFREYEVDGEHFSMLASRSSLLAKIQIEVGRLIENIPVQLTERGLG